jgi:hypothetical protein
MNCYKIWYIWVMLVVNPLQDLKYVNHIPAKRKNIASMK